LRWVRPDELDSLPWVPADTAWLTDLTAAMEGDSRHTSR
jgi:8-oxo-dGTP diphosphatase